MQSSVHAKRAWILIFVAIAAFYLWGLGLLPLVGPDEPRYAEVAREMLARRDFVTPTLGNFPWFEKPPLLYWLMMASYRVFGVNEYAARFGSALCGLMSAVFVYRAGKSVENAPLTFGAGAKPATDSADQSHDGLGQWSALVLLSSVGVIAFSRAASFDIAITMALTGALTCFVAWDIRGSRIAGRDAGAPQAGMPALQNAGLRQAGMPALLLGFYLFVGLALLAKGLIGIVIPFGVITLYYLMRQEWPRRNFLKSLLWGIPLTIAAAAVWYGPMFARHGWEFIDQFIIQHHFARFVSNKYHHPGPVYFYLPVLASLALPWTIVLAGAFISARQWNRRGDTPIDRLRMLALAWIVVPVAFFSFSGSKLMAYILPVMPAVALLVGERVTCFVNSGRGNKVVRLTGLLLIVLAAAGAWYSTEDSGLPFRPTGIALIPVTLVGAAALLAPHLRKALFVLIPLATLTASAIAVTCIMPATARRESVRDLLAAAAARGYGATPIVQLHTVERSAEFYAAGRLRYQSNAEPVRTESVAEVADAARQNNGVVLCFVPIEYESLLMTYTQTRNEELGNNGRVALVIVRAR